MKHNRISNCRVIELPKIAGPRGNLTFVEQMRHLPFEFKRVYYLYDVPGGEERGGHAHRNLEQFVISVNGSFDILLDDGFEQKRVQLNRAYYGLYIPQMIWRSLDNFSSGSFCLVLASRYYDAEDYIRDYDDFLELKKNKVLSSKGANPSDPTCGLPDCLRQLNR